MGNVYRSAGDGSVVLYEQGTRIYLRNLVGEGMGRAIILATDYGSDLTDVLWQGTVYYAYKNTEGDILIKNILEHRVLYRLRDAGGPEGFAPQLAAAAGELVLVYSTQNPLNGRYHLHCLFPFLSDEKKEQTESVMARFEEIFPQSQVWVPKLQIISLGQKTVFVGAQGDENIAEPKIVLLDSEMIWHEQHAHKSQSGEETPWESCQKELVQRDLLIESIKQQYEDLMNVAEQYRQEAIKWRSKFMR